MKDFETMVADTSIRISKETRERLDALKIVSKENFDEVIQRLLNITNPIIEDMKKGVRDDLLKNIILNDFAQYKINRRKEKEKLAK